MTREYYLQNKEKITEQNKQYHLANKEYLDIYRANNRKKLCELSKRWYHKNKELVRQRKYMRRNGWTLEQYLEFDKQQKMKKAAQTVNTNKCIQCGNSSSQSTCYHCTLARNFFKMS